MEKEEYELILSIHNDIARIKDSFDNAVSQMRIIKSTISDLQNALDVILADGDIKTEQEQRR